MSASFAGVLQGWRARFGLAPVAGRAGVLQLARRAQPLLADAVLRTG